MYADDQVEALMMMPNVPAKVIEVAKQFPKHIHDLERAKALVMLREWREADRTKTVAASQQVADDHRLLEELAAAVGSGERSSSSVMEEVLLIEARLKDAQRRHAALKNSAARYDAIEADPCAYFDAFYDKYPGLRDRRTSLRTYLAERGLSR